MSANDGSSFLGYQGRKGNAKETVTRLVEPNHHQAVEDQRHGRGSFHGLGKTIGGIFQTQELLAIFKGAFDGPATGVGGEDLPGGPIELGAVEHLIRSFPLQVAHQDDGQEAVTPGRVVEGLDRLDRQAGMEPELVEVEVASRVGSDPRPTPSCRASVSLSCGPVLWSFPSWEAPARRGPPWDGHG